MEGLIEKPVTPTPKPTPNPTPEKKPSPKQENDKKVPQTGDIT